MTTRKHSRRTSEANDETTRQHFLRPMSQVQAGLLINIFIEKFARNVFKDYMVLICGDGTLIKRRLKT